MSACHSCGTELAERIEVFRSSTCPACGKDLRVCLNCEFYAPGAHWDCRESITDPVREKDRANFCEFFRLARSTRATKNDASSKGAAAHERFDRLFGNG